MKKLTLVLLCVLLFIFDNTLVPFFSINGYYPSILYVFIISYSMISGKWEGIWIGVFAGILQDIYFFHGFGINALVNIFMCLSAAYIGENLFKEKTLIPIISIFFLGLLKGIIVFVLLYILSVSSDTKLILYNSIYNTLIAVIIYKRVFRLTEKPFMRREWKF